MLLKNDTCTNINSLPYTISSSGCYQFTSNLTTSNGSGITVNADNVVIDLKGYYMKSTLGYGTAVSYPDRGYTTIRNGSILGYANAIWSNPGTSGSLIENLVIKNGSNLDCAIEDSANGTIIRNNLIQGSSSNPAAIGICAQGPNARVINNDVIDFATGINLNGNAIADNNRLSLTNPVSGSVGFNGGSVSCSRNIVTGYETPGCY